MRVRDLFRPSRGSETDLSWSSTPWPPSGTTLAPSAVRRLTSVTARPRTTVLTRLLDLAPDTPEGTLTADGAARLLELLNRRGEAARRLNPARRPPWRVVPVQVVEVLSMDTPHRFVRHRGRRVARRSFTRSSRRAVQPCPKVAMITAEAQLPPALQELAKCTKDRIEGFDCEAEAASRGMGEGSLSRGTPKEEPLGSSPAPAGELELHFLFRSPSCPLRTTFRRRRPEPTTT